MKRKIFLVTALAVPLSGLDRDSNGISDLWTLLYEAGELVGVEDADADGISNYAESVAGTDPFAWEDVPRLRSLVEDEGGDEVSFMTKQGKMYQLHRSGDLNDFSPMGPEFRGTGGEIVVKLNDDGSSTLSAAVEHKYWGGVTEEDLDGFRAGEAYLNLPAGVTRHSDFEMPQFAAGGFGGRMRGWVSPEVSGDYVFHLSAASAADLYFRPNERGADLERVARVLQGQNGLSRGEWDSHASQSSASYFLEAGQSYLLEVWYVMTEESGHCQVGWQGPGMDKVELISQEDLGEALSPDALSDGGVIFERDYDSAGQDDVIWSNGTELVAGPSGMPGMVERFVSDPTTGQVSLLTGAGAGATQHFYATWLFQMGSGHREFDLNFRSAGDAGGIRVDFQSLFGQAFLLPNGSTARDLLIPVSLDETYRVEVVGTMAAGGFSYQAGQEFLTVADQSFDMYVSDADGSLVEVRRGLPFLGGNGEVQVIDALQASSLRNPNIYFDEWEVTKGVIEGNGYLTSNLSSEFVFERDYDSPRQDEVIWENGTELVRGPRGMTGMVESFVSDPTTDQVSLLKGGGTGANQHFYATWLFQMAEGHQNLDLKFQNAENARGIRVDIQGVSGEAVVQPNGRATRDIQIPVTFNETFRIEIVGTMATEGFLYRAGEEFLTLANQHFDLYVSDADGELVGVTRGLPFRDGGGELQVIDTLRASFVSDPNIYLDEWEVTEGVIEGSGYLASNVGGVIEPREEQNFYRLAISDGDQDGDGLTDWEELTLARHNQVHFFQAETTPNTYDPDLVSALSDEMTGDSIVRLVSSDRDAYERNTPFVTENHGSFVISRRGSLGRLVVNLCQTPLAETGNASTVCDGTCCSLIGTAGEEAAELEDYLLINEKGEVITDQVVFELGQTEHTITVVAVPDSVNEYPETLNLALVESENYRIGANNGASISLVDLPEHPDNRSIFTGAFSIDGRATSVSSASGSTTIILNGPRTEVLLFNQYSGLSSAQQDSHVHKSGLGPSPGSVVYAITNVPGDEESNPKNEPLTDEAGYPWNLEDSSGAVSSAGGSASKQVIIDSLFGQNNETPLYLNIHTVDNPDGEIWAFLSLSGGSQIAPLDPPLAAVMGTEEYPQLFGEELESEVRRFLNQATFGATDTSVLEMVTHIENERRRDASYHRAMAYEEWLDEQMDEAITPQSYVLDYVLAMDLQFYDVGGMFDPTLNKPNDEFPYTTPIAPATWPRIVRTASDPEAWHLSGLFPLISDSQRLATLNGLRFPGSSSHRHGLWQTMFNAEGQLRQKMGYALQQIVVTSTADTGLNRNAFGVSNYQDQLNHRAFMHYRDVLGYANWSPIMGRWLSSLQNQKGADLDGDGVDDIFPDENLARENMQLFSIGLFEMWPDGTLKLDENGLPQPTYTNDDIREFARVLTGLSFGKNNSEHNEGWGGVPYNAIPDNDSFAVGTLVDGHYSMRFAYPMRMFGEFHDTGVKRFAGTIIDNTDMRDATEQGVADIEQALDWLAGKPGDGLPDYEMENSHRSVPAFISRRLIQRFTTSNPSRDYLHRVATVFKDSEGDLGLTLKAILLDSEVRVPDAYHERFGMKKSPLETYLQIIRALDGTTYLPLYQPNENVEPFAGQVGDYGNPELYLRTYGYPGSQMALQDRNVRLMQSNTITAGAAGLQMVPFRQDTVFNFYLPDFSPSGPIANAGLVAPEMQLANDQDVIRNLNFYEDITRSSNGVTGDRLANSSTTQDELFGVDGTSNHVRMRLLHDKLVQRFYPAVPPAATAERSSESLADEMLLDELDRRLTLGYLKEKYPYDPSDDDDPSIPGVDDFLKNPRELIIDALSGYSDPFDGRNDDINKNSKIVDGLYLLVATPEFQIKK